jgi:hypothetical protein
MSTTLVGRDTLVLNGKILHNFASGKYVTLTFDNPLTNMMVSKDGNVLLVLNLNGQKVKITVRLQVGSFDDRQLQPQLQAWLSDPATFVPLAGSFSKRCGDGLGNVKTVVYQFVAASFGKIPGAEADSNGTEEQAVAVYEFEALLQSRSIQ